MQYEEKANTVSGMNHVLTMNREEYIRVNSRECLLWLNENAGIEYKDWLYMVFPPSTFTLMFRDKNTAMRFKLIWN